MACSKYLAIIQKKRTEHKGNPLKRDKKTQISKQQIFKIEPRSSQCQMIKLSQANQKLNNHSSYSWPKQGMKEMAQTMQEERK